ncbi:GNAT family N-acetyltransferase [Streptomyces kaniharaensis]|uniref:GNAT family N-acetyltransferase n=1 Tax=Streptomyces kaniharaensis TaxID=212423 RepID=A0A6N7KWJ7_9ACTN|nr:GNAT family N-acetyltransferase [Streptomyces kaniharaensis]MQS15890.1 GNAT family N-acetyltransferase [Streptomyces kaniharaensis]
MPELHDLELRRLTSDDWPLWRELRLASLAEAPYAFGSTLADWQGPGDHEERWRSRLEIPGALDLVAVLEGHPVAMASGVPADEDPAAAELISMWVGPQARGRGVGDRLIAEIAQWATALGYRTLKLAVMPHNEAAIALYRRHGFTDTDELGDLLDDGVSRELVLAKPLSA